MSSREWFPAVMGLILLAWPGSGEARATEAVDNAMASSAKTGRPVLAIAGSET